jgi:hypothetical protein
MDWKSAIDRMSWVYPVTQTEDIRIQQAIDAGVDFKDKLVLEPACHEGVLTCHMSSLGAKVDAFDIRAENIAKALIKTNMHGYNPYIFHFDANHISLMVKNKYDILLHSGLLYHLTHPATHLRNALRIAPITLLDTHVAMPDKELIQHDGCAGHWWQEDMSSYLGGTSAKSFWLAKDYLEHIIVKECRKKFEILNDEPEAKNGPRMYYLIT